MKRPEFHWVLAVGILLMILPKMVLGETWGFALTWLGVGLFVGGLLMK